MERDHWQDMGVDRRLILKSTLEKGFGDVE
jgi:hypothetical protein